MNKNTLLLLGFLSFVMFLFGLNYVFTPFREAISEKFINNEEVSEIKKETKNIDAVDTIFNKFNDKDKIGQLISWPIIIEKDGSIDDNDLTQDVYFELLSKKNAGFFTLFGDKISTISAKLTIDKIHEHNGSVLLPWVAVDHEGGKVQRLDGEGFTRLASWNSICKLDKKVTQRVLRQSAEELKEVGVKIVLAPMVDLGLPRGVLNTRLCSSNPDIVAKQANLFINAFKQQGILSVLKHFPGIGSVKEDLHKEYAVGRVGVEDVFIYRTLLDLNPNIGVMMSHIGIDNQFSEVPCSLSPDCVGELINNFHQTLVFTDALDMKAAFYVPESTTGAELEVQSLGDVTKRAILAGNNVLVYGPSVNVEQLSEVYDMLIREYNSDGKFKQKVDQSVKKIISYKLGVPIEKDEIQYKKLK
jgi:beta-N-acetylhexosaminidase